MAENDQKTRDTMSFGGSHGGRHCKIPPEETKSGKPCGAHPLRPGTVIEGVKVSGDYCRGHDPTLPSRTQLRAEDRAKGGKAKRIPKLSELLRKRVEAQADEILDKLFAMLDAERAVVVGNGPKARVEFVPDMELVLRVIREIFDRAEGRPKSVSEFTGKVDYRSPKQSDLIEKEIDRLTKKLADREIAERGAGAE